MVATHGSWQARTPATWLVCRLAKVNPRGVLDLVEAVLRDPLQGPGKPELLRYLLAGCWSRRITQEHRLVYRVSVESIDFLQARYHY